MHNTNVGTKRNRQKELNFFFAYVFFYGICVSPLPLLRHEFRMLEPREYLFLLRLTGVIGYSLLFYFLFLNLKNYTIKKMILFAWISFTLYCMYDWYNWSISNKDIYTPYTSIVGGILLFISFLFLLFEKIKINAGIPPYKMKIFWFTIAIISFCTGFLFLSLSFSQTAINNETFRKHYRIMTTTLVITKAILISIGLLIKEKPQLPLKS